MRQELRLPQPNRMNRIEEAEAILDNKIQVCYEK